jgi:hypothetical protein
MASLVHTYGLFQVCSTDLNRTEPQVNDTERTHDLSAIEVSSSYFGEQTLDQLDSPSCEHLLLDTHEPGHLPSRLTTLSRPSAPFLPYAASTSKLRCFDQFW